MMWVLSGHALEKGFALGSLSPWLFALARQSWLGVTVFLVLSGFLVAHVFAGLLEKRTFWPALGVFLWRRFARIWPALALGGLALQVAQSLLTGHAALSGCGSGNLGAWLYTNALFLGNDLDTSSVGGDSPIPRLWLFERMGVVQQNAACSSIAWTVSLEVQGYAIAPFFVAAIVADRRAGLAAAGLAFAGCVALRGVAFWNRVVESDATLTDKWVVYHDADLYEWLPYRFEETLAGVLAYHYAFPRRSKKAGEDAAKGGAATDGRAGAYAEAAFVVFFAGFLALTYGCFFEHDPANFGFGVPYDGPWRAFFFGWLCFPVAAAATASFIAAAYPPVWNSNLRPEFNVRIIERIAPDSSVALRELDESNRFVQKSAKSTSM